MIAYDGTDLVRERAGLLTQLWTKGRPWNIEVFIPVTME